MYIEIIFLQQHHTHKTTTKSCRRAQKAAAQERQGRLTRQGSQIVLRIGTRFPISHHDPICVAYLSTSVQVTGSLVAS